jgi:general secretion pathway protein G
MKNNLMARLRGQREDEGFTLIELLIVIVILGILAAIVVFSVSGVQNNSKTSACQTNVKTVDTALEAYYAQNSSAASNFNQLVSGGFLHSDQAINAAGTTITEGAYVMHFAANGTSVVDGTSGAGATTPLAGNAGGVWLTGTVPSGCTGA